MGGRGLATVVALSLGLGTGGIAQRPDPGDAPALEAAARDLCGREIVLLGESGTHGDGRTEAFKAALVRRLVGRCRFSAVLFEGSIYDALAWNRTLRHGGMADAASLGDAVGGLWKRDAEFRAMTPFLVERARADRLLIGGLDDNLGGEGEAYSLGPMADELASVLPEPRRSQCSAAMRARATYSYEPDAPAERARQIALLGCLDDASRASSGGDERKAMLDNFRRLVVSDTDPTAGFGARDRAMFDNLRWYKARLPRAAKVIVWAATIHIAKSARLETPGNVANFGEYVHDAYGRRAFALGFASHGGSYRVGTRPANRHVVAVLPVPADSLETRAAGVRAERLTSAPRASQCLARPRRRCSAMTRAELITGTRLWTA